VNIVQIVMAGIVITVLAILVKKIGKEIGTMVAILGGVLIFMMLLPHLVQVMGVLTDIAEQLDTGMEHIGIVLRVIGVAYIAEFGAQVCKDAGEGAIASKVELAGKVIVMAMAVPIITNFLQVVLVIVP